MSAPVAILLTGGGAIYVLSIYWPPSVASLMAALIGSLLVGVGVAEWLKK